jgi:hypothetical protein
VEKNMKNGFVGTVVLVVSFMALECFAESNLYPKLRVGQISKDLNG